MEKNSLIRKLNQTFIFISLVFFVFQCNVHGAEVDTIEIYSRAMDKDIKTVVIQPEGERNENLATLYLLHGYGGNYSNWVERAPHIKELADQYGILIVSPDGGHGSWYWDIEEDKQYQYETFITAELLSYIESNYGVSKDRNHRGITGLSMGGHGALYLALKHQEVYGAAGSTAGGVDFRPFPNNWEIKERLGEYAENKSKWENNTVIEMLHLYRPELGLELFVDCGEQDFFYEVNQNLHKRLNYLNIPHRYLTMPGKHNWDYWEKSILYQLTFFNGFFTKEVE